MKKFATLLLFGVIALSGCTHRYVLTLNNGSQIDALSKPKLKNGAYYYKDPHGQPAFISAGRVVEISPVSMARGVKGSQFLPTDRK